MRDLLAKHRDNAGCYECHRKIDPLGFALESFDPIGGWRTRNEKGTVIDTSGELPNGQRFSDVAGLKQALLQRKEQFARMLTERFVDVCVRSAHRGSGSPGSGPNYRGDGERRFSHARPDRGRRRERNLPLEIKYRSTFSVYCCTTFESPASRQRKTRALMSTVVVSFTFSTPW